MKIGFTGTRQGMTPEQIQAFGDLLRIIRGPIEEFHHGCCIGSDDQAGRIVKHLEPAAIVIGHPPSVVAFLADTPVDKLLPAKDFLSRNKDIVNATDYLIATPKEFAEQSRSGTWHTIRYARQQKKAVLIIWPSGKLRVERVAIDNKYAKVRTATS